MFFYVDSVLTLTDGVKEPVDFEKSMLTECFHSGWINSLSWNSTSGMLRDIVILTSSSLIRSTLFPRKCNFRLWTRWILSSRVTKYFQIVRQLQVNLTSRRITHELLCSKIHQTSCVFACNSFDDESIRPAVRRVDARRKKRALSDRFKAIWKKDLQKPRRRRPKWAETLRESYKMKAKRKEPDVRYRVLFTPSSLLPSSSTPPYQSRSFLFPSF